MLGRHSKIAQRELPRSILKCFPCTGPSTNSGQIRGPLLAQVGRGHDRPKFGQTWPVLEKFRRMRPTTSAAGSTVRAIFEELLTASAALARCISEAAGSVSRRRSKGDWHAPNCASKLLVPTSQGASRKVAPRPSSFTPPPVLQATCHEGTKARRRHATRATAPGEVIAHNARLHA